jgi:hypothetical protein
MKRVKIMVVLLFTTIVVAAQRWTEYNRLGDEARERDDFSAAKIYYEEGVPNCDSYSINQLTSIWLEDESMRTIMRNVMIRCMECLTKRATELQDTASMNKLILYHTEGIGVYKDDAKVEYWKEQLDLLRNVSVANTTVNTPREKVKMKFFTGYAASFYAPYGLTVGGVGRTVGWYLRFRTNMSFRNYATSVVEEGDLDMKFTEPEYGDVYPSPVADPKDKNKVISKVNLWMGTGGIVIKAMPSFYISAGAGYFNREKLYEIEKIGITEANSQGTVWVKHKDPKRSFNGWVLDLDATFQMGNVLYGSLGCSMLNFEYVSGNAGIGVFF